MTIKVKNAMCLIFNWNGQSHKLPRSSRLGLRFVHQTDYAFLVWRPTPDLPRRQCPETKNEDCDCFCVTSKSRVYICGIDKFSCKKLTMRSILPVTKPYNDYNVSYGRAEVLFSALQKFYCVSCTTWSYSQKITTPCSRKNVHLLCLNNSVKN